MLCLLFLLLDCHCKEEKDINCIYFWNINNFSWVTQVYTASPLPVYCVINRIPRPLCYYDTKSSGSINDVNPLSPLTGDATLQRHFSIFTLANTFLLGNFVLQLQTTLKRSVFDYKTFESLNSKRLFLIIHTPCRVSTDWFTFLNSIFQ